MRQKLVPTAALLLCLTLYSAVPCRVSTAQEPQDGRDIQAEEVLRARRKVNPRPGAKPASKTIAKPRVNTTVAQNEKPKPKVAQRVYRTDNANFPVGAPPQGVEYVQIGVTVWRTRPVEARDSDDTAKEIIDGKELTFERIEDHITDGEKFRLGIESLTGESLSNTGRYLYVINREQYKDGTFGRARLIFPTLLTYGGNNSVMPGLPIVLPRAEGKPFVVQRSSSEQVAETFTVILSRKELQLPERLSNKAMVLPDNWFPNLERQYGERMYPAILQGAIGQTKTKREQSVENREIKDEAESTLTRDDPPPQTVFRGAVKIGNPAIVTVALWFKD